jgi:hypothetical protein
MQLEIAHIILKMSGQNGATFMMKKKIIHLKNVGSMGETS